MLDFYHAELVARLGPEQSKAYTRAVMDRHYELALCDYVRFMAGWGSVCFPTPPFLLRQPLESFHGPQKALLMA